MLSKVVGLVSQGKLTEARRIVRGELDSRREAILAEGKAFVAASIKGDEKKKEPKEPKDGSHDGGAD
ncbi:hypothetical protein MYOV003v1_p0142 [Vibrio phage 207E48.1]|nr:hypothetical protein MYOV003v1_p0142 [Vibrio phage 207E48.1]